MLLERLILHRTVHFLQKQPNHSSTIHQIQDHLRQYEDVQILSNTRLRKIIYISELALVDFPMVFLAEINLDFVNNFMKLAENVQEYRYRYEDPAQPAGIKLENGKLLLDKMPCKVAPNHIDVNLGGQYLLHIQFTGKIAYSKFFFLN